MVGVYKYIMWILLCPAVGRVGWPPAPKKKNYLQKEKRLINDALLYRLHGPRDEIDADAYPLVTFQCKMTRNKCQMCQVWPAEYVCLYCRTNLIATLY